MLNTQPHPDILEFVKVRNEGALGTDRETWPYVSSIAYILDDRDGGDKLGSFYFFLSDLARHTKNLKTNPKASLLISEDKPDVPVHERKRVTVVGIIEPVEDAELKERLKVKYLETFPRAEIFFGLPDFHFYALEISEVNWYGGFGKAETFQ